MTTKAYTYLCLVRNILDINEGHFHKKSRLSPANSKGKKLMVSSEEDGKVLSINFRKRHSTHFILLMLHEFSKRRLFR